MKNFPVTFLMIFAFELWSSEAGPLFSFTGSLNVPSPGAKTNGSIFDEILSNFRREISEQDTVLENNLGNINKSLDVVNNAVDRIDHSLSDLVPVLMHMIVETRTLMNKMDKRLSCDKPLGEPINAQASWNAAEDRVTITCNEGFMTESKASEQTVECLGGRWTAYEPCKRICPDAFVSEGDLCLRYVSKLLNWKNANDNCAQMGHGATLAMLTTAGEARSFKDFLVNNDVYTDLEHLWLGAAEDTDDRGNWYWLNKYPVVFSDELQWMKGEPNDGDIRVEECLDFYIIDRELNDNSCYRDLPSVCEIRASDP